MTHNAWRIVLSAVLITIMVGCDGNARSTELPVDPAPTETSVELLSKDVSLHSVLASLEAVSQNHHMRERWAFGGIHRAPTIESVKDEVRHAVEAHQAADPAGLSAEYESCDMEGTSGVGPTGGSAPGTRTIMFMAHTKVWDSYTQQPCSVTKVGGQSSVEVRQGTYPIHGTAFGFSCWFCDFAYGSHQYQFSGPAVSAQIDTQHNASGFPDDYSGALASQI